MKIILDFLKDNYELVILICCYLVNLLAIFISIIKSPKKLATYFVALLDKLPQLLCEAEKIGFPSGESKKNFVIDLAINYLVCLTGWTPEKVSAIWSNQISLAIENMLSSPQKKGEN